MQHYSSQAFTDIGKPAGGASIAIKIAGTNTNATIYSDDGVTVKSNPFSANGLGQFDFYAASGKYDITISGTQITTYTLANQVVFDPFETSAGDTPFAIGSSTPPNSAGIGGFFAVTIWPQAPTAPAAACTALANNVWVFQFVLPFPAVINKVTIYQSIGSNDTMDFGIYNTAGTRICAVGGANALSTGAKTLSLTVPAVGPFNLPAGVYIFAQTCSSTTPTFFGPLIVGGGDATQVMNATPATRVGIAANPAVVGVLPATLGTISPQVPGRNPVMAFFER